MEVVPITTKEAMETISKDTSQVVITDQTAITGVVTKEMAGNQSTTMDRSTASLLVVLSTKLLIYRVVTLFRKTFIQKMKKQKIDHKKKSMSSWPKIK